MISPRQFLVCESAEHADFVDHFVMDYLRESQNANGNRWSGVYTNGTQFGILWASPVSDIFGLPEDFSSMSIVEESEEDIWTEHVEEPNSEESV